MATTKGIRTWRRTGADADRPVNERVVETTDADALDAALREADFVTIPREGVAPTGELLREGYDDAYAKALARVLAARYGYDGTVRTSTSGRSHVFEREALPQGADFDFGLDTDAALHAEGKALAPWEPRPPLRSAAHANGRANGNAEGEAFGPAEMPA